MAQGLRGDPGGILGLLTLLGQHEEAVEYDLIRLGLRLEDLGTNRLSWRDLVVIVNQTLILERPESALVRSVAGEVAEWDIHAYMLAGIYDSLAWLVWAKSEDAQQPVPVGMPQPLPRPGAAKDEGGPKLSMDEVKAWLVARNPHQHQGG